MKRVIDWKQTQRTVFFKDPVASWGCYVHGVQTLRQGSRHYAGKPSHRQEYRREGRNCYLHLNCKHGIRMNYSFFSCMQNSSSRWFLFCRTLGSSYLYKTCDTIYHSCRSKLQAATS